MCHHVCFTCIKSLHVYRTLSDIDGGGGVHTCCASRSVLQMHDCLIWRQTVKPVFWHDTGDTSDYEECEKYESPSNNRLTQYWPHKTQWNNRWSRTNNGQRTLIDRFKRVNPLTDLHDSVRHYCHQKSRFGMANRATCYFEAFKRIEERLDLPASNEYMTSGKIKYAERKTALRYRYGTIWTRKMAYRCGHAPSTNYQLPITKWPRQSGAPVGAAPPTRSQLRLQRHTQFPVQAQTMAATSPP